MIITLLGMVSLSLAGLGDVVDCLDEADISCARTALEPLNPDQSTDADVVLYAARTEFFDGNYEKAHKYLVRALELGAPDPYDDLGLYERTKVVTEGYALVSRDGYQMRYRAGLDAILVDDAIGAMEKSAKNIAPLMGGPPPGTILLEVFPHARAFTEASSLTEKNVRTTGVVALSKWSRLLMVSPRSLSGGHDWEDTIAHEYVHLVVSHHTRDRAPVWLQEAIAKYLDNRWRDGTDGFRLDPYSEGLLADAVKTGKLVTFEQMHPSLAKLPSAEMAGLAYAQLATLMAFSFDKGGESILTRVLPRVKNGEDPRIVLASEAGFQSLEALLDAWMDWIRNRGLQQRDIQSRPIAFETDDAVAGDPVMGSRRDLANFMRLGDLLQERGHHEASLIEYAKATAADGKGSPLLSTRIAVAQLALKDRQGALATTEESLLSYPDFAETHRVRGQILRALGRPKEAADAYRESVGIYPFNEECQKALSELYAELGNSNLASRHRRYLSILRRGGEG